MPQRVTLGRIALTGIGTLCGMSLAGLTANRFQLDLRQIRLIGAGLGGVIGFLASIFLLKNPRIVPVMSREDNLKKHFIEKHQSKIESAVTVLEKELTKSPTLSETQLNQILEITDEARLVVQHHQQYTKFVTILEEKLGAKKAKFAWEIPDLIPARIKDSSYIFSNEGIDQLVQVVANCFYNQDTLFEIGKIFREKKISPSIQQKVFTQVEIEKYQKGLLVLNAEIKGAIIELASKMQAEENFEEIMTQITTWVKQAPILNEELILEKFQIAKAIAPLSEERQKERRNKLQQIIHAAYVRQELRHKPKFVTGSDIEFNLLDCWGYKINTSDYENKEHVYDLFNDIVKSQIQIENSTSSIGLLSKILQESALRARLKMVNITADCQIEKFQMALNFWIQKREIFVEHLKDLKMIYPDNCPSLARKMLDESFEWLKQLSIKDKFKSFFKGRPKGFFTDLQFGANKFKAWLDERKCDRNVKAVQEECMQARDAEAFQKKINFYAKWGKYLKKENIQGLVDPSEALGGGVCWGHSCFLQMFFQKYPNLSVEEAAERINIQPVNRFLQASYAVRRRLGRNRLHTLSAHELKKGGFTLDENVSHIHRYSADKLKEILTLSIPVLEASSGWLRLSLQSKESGHAILVRLDSQREKIWLNDSNIGLFCFEEEGQTFEETQRLFYDFLKDLIDARYSDTQQIRAYQIT